MASNSNNSERYGLLDLLAEEFADRLRRGERPSLREYTDRHPELAAEIRELFPAMAKVERVEDFRNAEHAEDPLPARPALSQVGDYRILREIGRGGMGVVYEAEQISLARRVALKVLPNHGGRNALLRFHREAKAAASLHHTNIVPVFDVGGDGDVAFYAMQFIQGQGLDHVIDELRRLGETLRAPGPPEATAPEMPGISAMRPADQLRPARGARGRELSQPTEMLLSGKLAPAGPGAPASEPAATSKRPSNARADARGAASFPPEPADSAVLPGGTHVSEISASGRRLPYFRSVAQIGRQVAQGLAHAHARGILHRDIKPSNLLLDTSGIVWITDFGLAKTEDDGLTATGDVLGTLRYLAPERFRGEGDARADIYALGLTLYEMLSLRPAYDSTDRLRLIEQIKADEPARLRSLESGIPRDLETIVLKAIARHPDRRYSTADSMAEDLRRYLADEPILARRTSAVERCQRWARRHPMAVALSGMLAAVLALAIVGSLLAASRFATLAELERRSASSERAARLEADSARKSAEAARAAAQAEAYRATLSEVVALRAGRQLGWREEALGSLARLARMPTPRRNVVELRNQAVANLGEFGITKVAQFDASEFTQLDFSRDSRTLVSIDANGDVWLRDASDGGNPRRLVELSRYLASHPVRPDLRRIRILSNGDLAVVAANHQVAFFGFDDRKSARPPITRETANAVRLEVDQEGRRLAVGWDDGRIDIYDAATGGLEQSNARSNTSDFAISPDGRWLACLTSVGGHHQLVPADGRGEPAPLERPREDCYLTTFSPDGSTLASIIPNNTVVLWDLATRAERLFLRGHRESVYTFAFSPDGSMLASAGSDSTTRLWDTRDGQSLAVLPASRPTRALAFSPDGKHLADSTETGVVSLYELSGLREQRRLSGHVYGALNLAFHPSLPRLASSSNDKTVILWDAESARSLVQWGADDVWITGLAFSPDGKLIASARGNDDKAECAIRLWDVADGSPRKEFSTGDLHGVWALAFDPTSRRIAAGDSGGTISVFDIESGQVPLRENLGPSKIATVAFHEDGRRLLVGLEDGTIALLDLEQTGRSRRIQLNGGRGRLVVDGRSNRVITGDAEGAIIALSLSDLAVVHRLANGHRGSVEAMALRPDGRLLATAGQDRRVILRDPFTFETIMEFPEWTNRVEVLAFDASGRFLAYLGGNTDVNLWDLKLVHEGLSAIGLAWDQPTPDVDPSAPMRRGGQ